MEDLIKKQAALEFGEFAEEIAAQHYIREGYTVLDRRWRLGKIEIDIIAQKDDVLVMVEVKARGTSEEDALSALTRDKRRRMIRAADAYLQRFPGDMNYRFDIVVCIGTLQDYSIKYFENAFVSADVF